MENKTYRLPKEFLERLQILYPAEYSAICRTFNTDFKTTFRANFMKAETRTLLEILQKNYVKAKRLNFPDYAFLLDKPRLQDIEKMDLYKNGFIYVQNVSSMLPVSVLAPAENEKILDLCAAPGGKTTLIAAMARGRSKIVAVEQDEIRLQILRANIAIQGCNSCIETVHGDGGQFWKENEATFDRVLVDAPCSAEAGFKSRNARTFSYWSLRKVKDCAHIQRQLVYSGIKSLRPGGTLVYSTCTFAPEENEEVVQWILSKFEDIKLAKIEIPLTNTRSGLTAWNGKELNKTMSLCRRIIPNDYMEGFFAAKMIKSK